MMDGVVLMAYGSPRRREDVEAYYTDIRRGRPPSAEQLADLLRRYDTIGGLSPLVERSEAQRDALQAALDARCGGRFRVVLGYKHADPLIEEAVSELAGRMGRSDGLVEVWNGVPWFSPVWYRRPHLTILHHVHGPMWDQIMPGPLAGAGRLLEARLAPPFYRSSEVVTPSEATRDELLGLGLRRVGEGEVRDVVPRGEVAHDVPRA